MFNKYNVIFLFIIAFLGMSCKSNALPKVKNPSYKMYNLSGEKGYRVTFEIKDNSAVPTAIVINKIKQTIATDAKEGNTYKVNVIAETRKIFGYKKQVVDKENGIFFKTDSSDVFKPVNFKLIEE